MSCARHRRGQSELPDHRLKHESNWHVATTNTGQLIWTSPDGIEQTTAAEPALHCGLGYQTVLAGPTSYGGAK